MYSAFSKSPNRRPGSSKICAVVERSDHHYGHDLVYLIMTLMTFSCGSAKKINWERVFSWFEDLRCVYAVSLELPFNYRLVYQHLNIGKLLTLSYGFLCNYCMQFLHARIAARCKNCRQIKRVGKYWLTAKHPAQNLKIACKNRTCNHSFRQIDVRAFYAAIASGYSDRPDICHQNSSSGLC